MMKKMILIICILLITGLLKAQDTNTFNHVAISVKDVNRSADFYKKVLRLKEITNRTEIKGIRWFSLGENIELHLISIKNEDFKIDKAIHLALSTLHFDTFLKTLVDKNIVYSDWPGTLNIINKRADGIKQIYFQDLDDYWIEINSVEENINI